MIAGWLLIALLACVVAALVVTRHHGGQSGFEAHVIAMPSAPRDAIRDRLGAAGLQVAFVDAVEGAKVKDRSQFDEKRFPFNSGQVGCALSHLRLWQSLRGPALILEDDAIPMQPDLERAVNDMLRELDPSTDIVFLGHCFEKKGARYRQSKNLYKSVLPRCTHAYYVTQGGLEKLARMASTSVLDEPIDEVLSKMCKRGDLNCLSYFPQLVRQPWQD